MKTVRIAIDSYRGIQEFTKIIGLYTNEFDLVQGRYIVNAKSTMGILSLDISKPLYLNIRDAGASLDQIIESLAPFIVEDDDTFQEA